MPMHVCGNCRAIHWNALDAEVCCLSVDLDAFDRDDASEPHSSTGGAAT